MRQHVGYLQIEPTTRCNYICGFCAGRHMEQQDLPLDDFKHLLDSIDGIKHIELQGEGEPLLHPHFFEMVSYAKERSPNADISFITNGSLFTKENIARIINASIHTILVSIESPREEEFQRIRGGKLSRVIRGIKELVEQKNSVNSSLKIGFAVTILKQTVEHLSEIGELYQELKLDGGIVLQPLQSMECYTQYYNTDLRESIPTAADGNRIRNIIATDKTLQLALTEYRKTKSFYSGLFSSVAGPRATCAWLENGLYVSASGIASSCCFVKNYSRDGFGQIDANLDLLLQKRNAQAAELKNGIYPSQCKGCDIARHVVQSNAK